jgi:hypothetical protein
MKKMEDTGLYTADGQKILREEETAPGEEGVHPSELPGQDMQALMVEEQRLLGKLNGLVSKQTMSRGDLHQAVLVLGHMIGLYRELVAQAVLNSNLVANSAMQMEQVTYALSLQVAALEKFGREKELFTDEERDAFIDDLHKQQQERVAEMRKAQEEEFMKANEEATACASTAHHYEDENTDPPEVEDSYAPEAGELINVNFGDNNE